MKGSNINKIIHKIRNNWFLRLAMYGMSVFLVIVILVSLSLRIYTQHSKVLSVPDFRGMTMDEILDTSKKAVLRFEIIDSVYLSDFKKGAVVSQIPAANAKVKKGRKIFLTLNAVTPEMTVMPDVTDVSFRQAQSMLELHGLKVGRIIYRPHIAKDYVLEQMRDSIKINPYTRIKKGTYIDLVLGSGPTNEKTSVPNLSNLSIIQAKEKLINVLLNMGTVMFDNTVISKEDSIKAVIYKQYPKYDPEAKTGLGTFIYVWATTDTTKVCHTTNPEEL